MGVRPDQAGPGSRGLVTRMRAGVADAVRAGGQLRGLTPAALVSFLTAAAFAPLLVPLVGSAGGGEVAAVLSQVGGVGGGYLAGVLSDVLRRAGRAGPAGTGPPTAELIRAELAAAIRQALEAPGGTGTSLRGEVSTVLQKVDAVQAALAADQDNVLAAGLAALGEQVADFRWVLGDVAPRLAEVQRMLAAQGASQRSHMLAARGELDVITGLLQRVVAAQEAQPQTAGTPGEPGTADGRRDVCPYPGLRPFEGRDARWFFGREDLTAHVIGRLAEQLGSGAPLLVIGPSGAGKSSLLRAGVIPGLRDGLLPVPGSRRWPRVLVSRPGSRPLAALAAAARRSGAPQGALRAALDTEPGAGAAALAGHLLDGRKADRLVLVVDQFEDIFTECRDSGERLQFVRVLLALARLPAGALVVLGVRADFYEDCAGIEELRALLPDYQLVVGQLDEAGLRRAITRPAAAAGLGLEPGLTELMLSDLGLRAGGDGSYQPGALPLLGYALQATWDRRTARVLTVAGYRDAGGIHGAIASEAERIYADFPPATREVTRRIMLRLVSAGPGTQETRRSVPPAELVTGLDATAARAVVARFTRARLMSAGQDGVEITHEAFLGAWPRLREWIAEDRAGLRLHGQLRDNARAWAGAGSTPSSTCGIWPGTGCCTS
ncbi:MAG TPA: hypothetical protein VLW44_19220 [Streptosporangiaceae bacterium]|nr:hypothetical protein [Streptosporangiaceae bacterium]